jgi:hypothetical protein
MKNKSYGKEKCMAIIKEYMPYLLKYQPTMWLTNEEREIGNQGEDFDKDFYMWDLINLWDKNPSKQLPNIWIVQRSKDDQIGIFFNSEDMFLNGQDVAEDIDNIKPISINVFSKKNFQDVMKLLKEQNN